MEKPATVHLEKSGTGVQVVDILTLQPTSEENTKLLRKIDLILMPLMGICYMLQLLDKLTLNFSSQLGLNEDLQLPPGVVRLPLGRYIATTVTLWGAVLMFHAACHNFVEFMVVRFLLGVTEAAVAPGFGLIVSMFYTRREQPLRQGFWFCGNCVANIVGGLIGYGVGYVNSALAPWRVLFLILGGATVAYSILLIAFLPDSPMKARFLNEREKRLVIQRTLENKTGVMDENEFRMAQMWEAFRDPQSWLIVLYTFSVNICNGGISTFNSILIDGFGFSPLMALLLQMPVGGCQLVVLAAGTILATILPSARILVMTCICAISLAGMLLIYCLSQSHPYGRLVGTYLAAVFAANIPLSLSLVGSNVGGFTKRSVVNGMLFLAYSAGSIIGPQFYFSSQRPSYPTGIRTGISCLTFGMLLLVVLFAYYFLENRRREKRRGTTPAASEDENTVDALSNRTDREMPHFRYVM